MFTQVTSTKPLVAMTALKLVISQPYVTWMPLNSATQQAYYVTGASKARARTPRTRVQKRVNFRLQSRLVPELSAQTSKGRHLDLISLRRLLVALRRSMLPRMLSRFSVLQVSHYKIQGHSVQRSK